MWIGYVLGLAMAQGHGLVLTKSLQWHGGFDTLPAASGEAAVSVGEDGLLLDFGWAQIRSSSDPLHNLDSKTGTGLLLENRSNVVIRHLKVNGYRWNIRLVNCHNVRIEDCDVSGSRSQRISYGTKEVDTFLDIRHPDAWREYGAGILMDHCTDCTVVGNQSHGSQNGALLIGTTFSRLIHNDFSFNSGWGMCLAESTDNQIQGNRLDFCNRPWAGGWGGDSAALGLADGSSRNIIADNSMQFGGDGFFLTDAVNGGFADGAFHISGSSDSNVVIRNVGNYASANAFEATFSDGNVFLDNVASGANYGFWIGFSRNCALMGNVIAANHTDGIAGGQGGSNLLVGNAFGENGGSDINVWSDGGAAEVARPANSLIIGGSSYGPPAPVAPLPPGEDLPMFFVGEGVEKHFVSNPVIQFRNASGWYLDASGNLWPFGGQGGMVFAKGIIDGVNQRPLVKEALALPIDSIKANPTPWLVAGPYAPVDFSESLAAWRMTSPAEIELRLMGEGVEVSAPFGMKFQDEPGHPLRLRLQAPPVTGGVGVEETYRVTLHQPSQHRSQAILGEFCSVSWNESWFDWGRPKALGYDDVAGWSALFSGPALAHQVVDSLDADYTGRSPVPGVVPADHFALVATTKVKFLGGQYDFSTLSDDGIRLKIDGKDVISRWNHHGATADDAKVSLSPGVHAIEVDYCQEDGGAVLKVGWSRLAPAQE